MLIKLSAGCLLTGALSIQLAAAASIVTPKPTSGTPTQAIAITGSGFGDSEAVDVYLDTTDTLLLVSSATGTLTGSITIPVSALPGAHSVTAIGRKSGDAAQAALTVTTPWMKFGYGAADLGLNPYENVLSPSTVPSLGTLWSANIGATGGTPIIANNRVYTGTTTGVVALNAATGATLWNKNLGAYFNASPTLVGTTLYIGDRNGNFYALNANSGATIWKVALNSGGFYGSAATANGIIYVGGANGTFFALKASAKGQVVWSYSVGSEPITVTPALANGDVYFAAYTNYVYCLDGATGALVWTYQTGNAIDSSPAIANGLLYIGSYDNIVYALGTTPANAGQLVWSYTTGGAVVGSPTVANGFVYIGSYDGKLYSLNARTGAVYVSLATGANVHSAMTANGVVYFTTSLNTVFAVSTYGSVLASGSVGTTFLGSPAVSDGRLFIATSEGELVAYTPNGGTDIVHAHAPRPSSLRPDMNLQVTR
jgi:outer membrane protein assembly factor BamB